MTYILLAAGDYCIRIGGGDGAEHFYGLELAFAEQTKVEPSVVGVSEPGMKILVPDERRRDQSAPPEEISRKK